MNRVDAELFETGKEVCCNINGILELRTSEIACHAEREEEGKRQREQWNGVCRINMVGEIRKMYFCGQWCDQRASDTRRDYCRRLGTVIRKLSNAQHRTPPKLV